MKLISISLPLLSLVSSQVSAQSCSEPRYPPPSVRPPPKAGYAGHNFAAWTPPPPEHLYGTYHITHTSHPQWVSAVNLRSERYPIDPSNDEFPAGSQSETRSCSTCANPNATDCKDPNAITTAFGHGVPIGALGPTDTKYTAAWKSNAAGESNRHAIVAWGQDRDGSDYFVQYGTDVNTNGGGIEITSRNEKGGISPATYSYLSSSLKQLAEELEDIELSATVSLIQPLRDDGRRNSEGPLGVAF